MDIQHPLMFSIMTRASPDRIRWMVHNLIDGMDEIIQTDAETGVTALIACTFRDDDDSESLRLLKMMIEELNAEVNLRDTGPGGTALLMAAQNGKPNMLQYLVDVGGFISMTFRGSTTTPIALAAQHEQTKCVAVLANACRDQSQLELLDVRNGSFAKTLQIQPLPWDFARFWAF